MGKQDGSTEATTLKNLPHPKPSYDLLSTHKQQAQAPPAAHTPSTPGAGGSSESGAGSLGSVSRAGSGSVLAGSTAAVAGSSGSESSTGSGDVLPRFDAASKWPLPIVYESQEEEAHVVLAEQQGRASSNEKISGSERGTHRSSGSSSNASSGGLTNMGTDGSSKATDSSSRSLTGMSTASLLQSLSAAVSRPHSQQRQRLLEQRPPAPQLQSQSQQSQTKQPHQQQHPPPQQQQQQQQPRNQQPHLQQPFEQEQRYGKQERQSPRQQTTKASGGISWSVPRPSVSATTISPTPPPPDSRPQPQPHPSSPIRPQLNLPAAPFPSGSTLPWFFPPPTSNNTARTSPPPSPSPHPSYATVPARSAGTEGAGSPAHPRPSPVGPSSMSPPYHSTSVASAARPPSSGGAAAAGAHPRPSVSAGPSVLPAHSSLGSTARPPGSTTSAAGTLLATHTRPSSAGPSLSRDTIARERTQGLGACSPARAAQHGRPSSAQAQSAGAQPRSAQIYPEAPLLSSPPRRSPTVATTAAHSLSPPRGPDQFLHHLTPGVRFNYARVCMCVWVVFVFVLAY